VDEKKKTFELKIVERNMCLTFNNERFIITECKKNRGQIFKLENAVNVVKLLEKESMPKDLRVVKIDNEEKNTGEDNKMYRKFRQWLAVKTSGKKKKKHNKQRKMAEEETSDDSEEDADTIEKNGNQRNNKHMVEEDRNHGVIRRRNDHRIIGKGGIEKRNVKSEEMAGDWKSNRLNDFLDEDREGTKKGYWKELFDEGKDSMDGLDLGQAIGKLAQDNDLKKSQNSMLFSGYGIENKAVGKVLSQGEKIAAGNELRMNSRPVYGSEIGRIHPESTSHSSGQYFQTNYQRNAVRSSNR
jgi:hypothetical protein